MTIGQRPTNAEIAYTPAPRVPVPLRNFIMGEPEIHVVSQSLSEKKSRSSKKSKRSPGLENCTPQSVPKRQRKDKTAVDDSLKTDEGVRKEPGVRLSTNTQSFRHLFSFGSKTGPVKDRHGLEPGPKDVRIGGDSDDSASVESPEDTKEVFSLLGKPVVAGEKDSPVGDSAPVQFAVHAAPLTLTPNTHDAKPEPLAKPIAEEYVVRDGLVLDSDFDVLSMARTFCGADCSVERLESEWFDGGKKEVIREVLRTKRHKHLRGRTLGSTAGQSEVP